MTRKVRRGLHEIIGITCGIQEPWDASPCGGTLFIERCKADGTTLSNDPDFRWETYCDTCKTCDCNGWPTLADSVREAVTYFDAK